MRSFSIRNLRDIRYLCHFAGVLLTLASGCATKPVPLPVAVPVLNIYQPSILVLPAGKPVFTEEGVYTPQTREIWHSDKRYRELERKGY